jgi:ATP-binding cassette subfamily B protein
VTDPPAPAAAPTDPPRRPKDHPHHRPHDRATITSGVAALLPYAAGARGRLLAAAALAALAAAAELVPYYAVYRALDAVVQGRVGPGGDGGELVTWALLALAGVLGRHVLFGLAMFVSHLAAYDLLQRLRVRMAERLARVPLGWFSSRRSGELKKVMADDVERLELFLAHAVPDLAAAATVGAATTAWLLVRDWRVGLAAIVVVPVAFACMAASLRRSDERVVGYHRSLGTMNAAVVEHVRGLPVVKVFNRTGDSVADTERAVRDHARWVGELTRRFLPLGTAYYSLVVASVFLVAPVATALALAGRLDTSDVVFFFVIGLGYGYPIARLYTTWSNLVHLSFGGNLVDEVLSAATLDAGAPRRLAGPTVAFEDVRFAYEPGRDVLRGVSFVAPAGTVTALVGPSGGGKTTIARLIPRFWDVDPGGDRGGHRGRHRGTVRIGGVDVRELPIEQLMDTVAFVFQDAFLFDDTVAANLRAGRPGATLDELRDAARAARVLDTIEALPSGWDTTVGARGSRLSGGERQRLALARAMLKDAPVVVLDEATAFVDPENEALIQDAIGSLVAGKTVVVIAHRLSTVVPADQILVVDGGRIVERGRHAELVAAGGPYARLWADYVAADAMPLREGR